MAQIPSTKPHVVMIPFPAQGHINPLLKLAKLLHAHGFHITFVNTEYSRKRMLQSLDSTTLTSLDDFRFETLPDHYESRTTGFLCYSIPKLCLDPLRELVLKLNNSPTECPPVTCMITDGVMSFTLDVAKELGIPAMFFWTTSACGYMSYLHNQHLIDRGLVPLKDLSDGYLDTKVDWVPGMSDMTLRDFPRWIRTTDANDYMLHFNIYEAQRASMATAVILNTYDDLERPVLEALAPMVPPVYTVGPLDFLLNETPNPRLKSVNINLWKEDQSCLEWLDQREPGSVVYVNFGSLVVTTNDQLIEFAWGLAKSKYHFLWIIRPDLVKGEAAVLPEEFSSEIKERGLLASWCQQEVVLSHPAIGGFLTHSGWNSTLESISNGVPMLCWPFFAEQTTNCKYSCTIWGVAMEINNVVIRDEVEGMVRELMGGEKGKEMRRRALEWKGKAIGAAKPGGSSFMNLERMVKEVLHLIKE